MSNVIPLDKLVITRVKANWYMARIHGAAFFARSRSEVFMKHRRWALEQKRVKDAIAQYENILHLRHCTEARA